MVFPLALCLVPALYVVCLGPVVVKNHASLALGCGEKKRRMNVDSTTLILAVAFVVLLVAYTMRRRSRVRSEE